MPEKRASLYEPTALQPHRFAAMALRALEKQTAYPRGSLHRHVIQIPQKLPQHDQQIVMWAHISRPSALEPGFLNVKPGLLLASLSLKGQILKKISAAVRLVVSSAVELVTGGSGASKKMKQVGSEWVSLVLRA